MSEVDQAWSQMRDAASVVARDLVSKIAPLEQELMATRARVKELEKQIDAQTLVLVRVRSIVEGRRDPVFSEQWVSKAEEAA